MNSRSEGFLFNSARVHDVLASENKKLLSEIVSLDPPRLLDTNPEELANHFESKFHVDVPVIDEDQIYVVQSEIQIKLDARYEHAGYGRSGQNSVIGTRVTYNIPFVGDKNVFAVQPSSFTTNPPRGIISGEVIQIHYDERVLNAVQLKGVFNSDLSNLRNYLRYLTSDCDAFNRNLRQIAFDAITNRRSKLIENQKIVSDLGYPLKERSGASGTFAFPAKRTQIPMPSPSKVAGQALEPALDMKMYESILSILQNVALGIERAPKSFINLDEEALRQHFLIHLNGHFEGNATGETFNAEGKTDILIRVDGRNVFIAECKFWGGPKTLSDAIDQVLGYATWRDTKVAILVFNQNKNFSSVVSQFPSIVQNHEAFVREVPFKSETGYRAIIRNKNDESRELTLTILGFDIPNGS